MKKKFLGIIMSISLLATLLVPSVSASDEIQNAYKEILKEYIHDFGDWVGYTTFDINNDGTKELIVELGGSTGSHAYGYINENTKDYEHCADNVIGYYEKNNNLYVLCSALTMVDEYYVTSELWLDRLFLHDNQIFHDTIYQNPSYKRTMSDVDTVPGRNIPEISNFLNGAKEIKFLSISNYYLLDDLTQIKVILDGIELSFDQPPIMESDRVMVPMRAIFEELGYDISWNQNTKTATADNWYNTITVQINNPSIYYDGGVYHCDVSPKVISDRTLVPLRAIAECAGCDVEWNGSENTVYIYSN